MWTLFNEPEQRDPDGENDRFHSFVMLSHTNHTRLLSVELEELSGEGIEIFAEGPTIAAGNLYGNTRIVQVFAEGVKLLNGGMCCLFLCAVRESYRNACHTVRCLQELRWEEFDGKIVFASICDPYVILLLDTGQPRCAHTLSDSVCIHL